VKFDLITADPPWKFGDSLQMSDTKRGAVDNYQGVMSLDDVVGLSTYVRQLSEENCILGI
jgi:hypothetical protein